VELYAPTNAVVIELPAGPKALDFHVLDERHVYATTRGSDARSGTAAPSSGGASIVFEDDVPQPTRSDIPSATCGGPSQRHSRAGGGRSPVKAQLLIDVASGIAARCYAFEYEGFAGCDSGDCRGPCVTSSRAGEVWQDDNLPTSGRKCRICRIDLRPNVARGQSSPAYIGHAQIDLIGRNL
jgi:hypothetical protein